ncbi:MAG: helix-turn-helix transcriptional regulator [Deltaproteobacteria bacterium]|nr:helix-turn-helix transcriptional regulator [Deltaproteobacteria bacterium]
MINEKEIGGRIRSCRIASNLTLQQLSNMTGLSVGYLSKLEKSDKGPPVSTLGTLGKALNVSISFLLGEENGGKNIFVTRKDSRLLVAGLGTSYGYSYESLAADYINRHIEPYILTLTARSETKFLFQHDSEELLFVIKGRMKFKHGDQKYILDEGDSVFFDGKIPHLCEAADEKEVKCVCVMYNR